MSWIIPVKDMDAFWISFWATLYSGVIYSIITGVIVGLVIWGVQSKVERKREIKKYEIDVSVFKSQLRMLIDRPDILTVDNISSLQSPVVETVNLLKEYPIVIWKHNLMSESDLMILLINLQNNYLKVLSIAKKLDSRLKTLIRRNNSTNELASLNDRAPYIYFVGRLFGLENNEVSPWLDIPVEGVPEWIKECYQNVVEDETIVELTQSYLDGRKTLDKDIKKIKDILDRN